MHVIRLALIKVETQKATSVPSPKVKHIERGCDKSKAKTRKRPNKELHKHEKERHRQDHPTNQVKSPTLLINW